MNNQLTKRDLVEGHLYILFYPNKKALYVGIEEKDVSLLSGTQPGTMVVYHFFIIEDKKNIYLSESMIPVNIGNIKD